jgi:DNA modification methylase
LTEKMSKVELIHGDCMEAIAKMKDNFIDAIVTDPPYGLSFMGKKWDYDVPSVEIWKECLRILKPGGYLLSFAGTRTQHRMAVNIEDAGFEIRDMIAWVYSTGFPKSLNLNKALQKKCTCGNMEAYDLHRTKEKSKHNLRPLQETNLPQEITTGQAEGEILQSGVSEQSLPIQQPESTENVWEGQPSLERRNNAEKNARELSGNDLCEMSKGIPENGEEGWIHNGTQISDGTTPEQIAGEIGGSSSYRPQSEKQSDREPCSFCKQYGTQETRRLYEETYGIGSALKPALEPITIARKPVSEKTLVDNFIKWGVGGINIDGCRIPLSGDKPRIGNTDESKTNTYGWERGGIYKSGTMPESGRFPSNFIHDGSQEVLDLFPQSAGQMGDLRAGIKKNKYNCYGDFGQTTEMLKRNDSGSAARFFYCAKASKSERNRGCEGLEAIRHADRIIDDGVGGNNPRNRTNTPKQNFHPTVKPIALMEYLVKLVTREGQIVLDPFAGSGTTGIACKNLNREAILIEREAEYVEIAECRNS